MNNRARLILSLIPIFILIPLLLGSFVVPTDVIEPGFENRISPVGIDDGRIDPPPTLQFFSDTTHTNTTAVLTAIATDYLENAGIRWIKIYEDGQEWGYKDCGGQTTCTFVKVKTETQPANHTYYSETKDLGNHVVESDRITIWFEGINQPPVINDYVPQDLIPSVDEGQTLHFEIWASDPNNDPLYYTWNLDGQEVSTISSYDYQPDYNASGLHDVYVIVYDNKGGEDALAWNVSVVNVLLNTSCFLNFDPESPSVYPVDVNASCYCTNPEAQAELWIYDVNITQYNNIPIPLPAGIFNYTCNVTETQNYHGASNSSLYVVNQDNHTIHLALNGQENDLSVPFNSTTNATGWLDISQGASNALLYRDSQIVASGSPATEIAQLGVGLYNYTYYYPASQNYTEQSLTRWLTVGQTNSSCTLNFVPQSPITYDQQPFIASCSCTNPEANAELWRDGFNVTNENNLPITLAANPSGYNYICNVTATQNYSGASTSALYIIDPATTILTLDSQPSWNVTYPTTTNVSCTANNNEVLINLYRNGQIVNNPDVSLLSVGSYGYVCNTSGNQNWSAASINNILIVNPAFSLVNLRLNGIDDNITVSVNDIVNMTGYLIIPVHPSPHQEEYPVIDGMPNPNEDTDAIQSRQGIYELQLYLDTQLINVDNYTVTNITSFNQTGIHNVSVIYPGSQNYSSSFETHWINVTVLNDTESPVVNLIFPPNNSVTNENVTIIYNVTDNMDLLLDCNIYSNTSGAWQIDGSQQTANATNGNWNYTNLSNGVYLWNVECTDDSFNSAFAVENWTFIVNVSGPDIIPPDVWNVNAIPQFINQSENTLLSAFARDNVAVDTVLAQVTYPDLTMNNFTMSPGMAVDQYLYDFINTMQVGNYSVRIFANDTSNNWNTTETTWFVVQVIPGYGNTTTIITQPNDNAVFNLSDVFLTEANITAVGGDVVNCNATITFSNNTVLTTPTPVNVLGNITSGTTIITQWNVTAAAVGISDITVTTTCEFGGSSFDSVYNITVTITGDIEPPVVNLVSPLNGSVIPIENVTVIYNVTDNMDLLLDCNIYSDASGSWQIDGSQQTANATTDTYDYLNLPDGTYTWNVECIDDSFNSAFAIENWTFTINTTIPDIEPPVVNLIFPPNNSVTNENVTIIYNVTDNMDLLLDCNIYSNTSGAWQVDGSQQTANATNGNWNYNNLSNGVYLWNVECIDDAFNSAFAVENWTFIVNTSVIIHDVGIDNNYTNTVNGIRISYNGTAILDDPANLTQGLTYELKARVNNYGTQPETVNMTYYLVNSTHKIVLYTTQSVINVFTYPTYDWDTTGYELGTYNITLNATIIGFVDENPSDNERNRTINIISLVDLPPWWLNEQVNPISPVVYGSGPYDFSIEWLDDFGVDTVIFEFDGTNYTPVCNPGLPSLDTNCSFVFSDLAVGTYNYRWYANDTINQWNSTSLLTYIIMQDNHTIYLALNGQENDLSVLFNSTTNATGWLDISQGASNALLYRDSQIVASGSPATEIAQLGVGLYNYTYYYPASQNYTEQSLTRWLNVTQGTTVLNLSAQPGWNVTVGTETNITCQANNNEVLINLYRNDTLVASGYTLIYETATLPEGAYGYVCNTTGSQNWTAASVNNILIVSALFPGEVHLYLNGIENNLTIDYGTISNATGTTPYGYITLYRNGTMVANGTSPQSEIATLAAGYYSYTAVSNGDENHSSASVTYFLTINKANSSVTLYLNSLNSDIIITEGESVNHTGILNIPTTGDLSLLRNGTQFAFGASPLTDISVYNNPGYYNITAYYAGNENYSEGSATHFITVLEAIHDISVDSIELIKEVNGTNKSVSSSTAWLYDVVYVKANVSNVGNQNETNINVTLEDNSVPVDWQLINLDIGQTQEVTLLWNANNDNWRTVKVKSLPVPGETNLANNELSQDVRVWKVCDAIDCSIFRPTTNQSSYPLGQQFLVRSVIQNLWATQSFYDLRVELEVSSGLTILPTWPAIQWYDLAPSQFKIANWNVTSTTTGLKTLTSWAGNHEFSNNTQITIT